jgi:hypothetical protein
MPLATRAVLRPRKPECDGPDAEVIVDTVVSTLSPVMCCPVNNSPKMLSGLRAGFV